MHTGLLSTLEMTVLHRPDTYQSTLLKAISCELMQSVD